MTKPPVSFICFNRPDCTEKVFDQIRRFQPGILLLVADGPRANVPTDAARCEAVRKIMTRVDWPCDVRKNFAEKNLGCKTRIATGLDWVFSEVEEAIILEDDCLPCADFFTYASELLARYRAEPSVMHIGGHNFQAGRVRGNASYYFSIYSHVWGWATWRRAWKNYDVNMASWPQARRDGLMDSLGFDRVEREYWTNILERTHAGEFGTWDFQWFYACLRQKGLSIIPNVNLITNIGASPDATHTKLPEGSLAVATGTLSELRHPARIRRDMAADRFSFDEHYGGKAIRAEASLFRRVRRQLGKVKRKIFAPRRATALRPGATAAPK